MSGKNIPCVNDCAYLVTVNRNILEKVTTQKDWLSNLLYHWFWTFECNLFFHSENSVLIIQKYSKNIICWKFCLFIIY